MTASELNLQQHTFLTDSNVLQLLLYLSQEREQVALLQYWLAKVIAQDGYEINSNTLDTLSPNLTSPCATWFSMRFTLETAGSGNLILKLHNFHLPLLHQWAALLPAEEHFAHTNHLMDVK
jgi:hypothetical protein